MKYKKLLFPHGKKKMNTGLDPGSKWTENGPNNDGVGLYGGLTDQVDADVKFDEAKKTYSKADIVVAYSVVDNRNGLNPENTVQLAYTYAKTQTQTHTVVSSVNTSLKIDVVARATILGIGADATSAFSFDYTYNVTNSTTTQESEQTTLSQNVDVSVPKGRVYQVKLVGTRTTLTVPITSYVYVTGNSETWFPSKVNDHYNWITDAGDLFSSVNQFKTAGGQSNLYSSIDDVGVIAMPGIITGISMINFYTVVEDITDQVNAQFPVPFVLTPPRNLLLKTAGGDMMVAPIRRNNRKRILFFLLAFFLITFAIRLYV